MLKRALAVLGFLFLALPAWGQVPGTTIQVGRTPITQGTTGLCLYDNAGKVGEQACGTGTAADIKVGTTTVSSGTTTRILYDNAGVLGEYTLTGTGTIAVMQTSPTLITPVLGVAAGTSLDLSANLTLASASTISWNSADLVLRRSAAANLAHGAADAAVAVAQTVSVQSVVAGTSNTAGAAWTFKGSQGTGSGAGGSILFQTAPAGGSGTSQNALVTAITIASTGIVTTVSDMNAGGNLSGANLSVNAGGYVNWSGRGLIKSPADGVHTLFNQASSDYGRLQFGGTTNLFPSWKRSSTTLAARLADDSADSPISASTITLSALANTATTSALCYNTGTGVVTYNSTVGTCTVSALRYKTPMGKVSEEEAVIGLRSLRVESWNYKKMSGLDDRERVGLYADDVAKMDKRCAVYDEKGQVENYDDRCVIAYLVGAVKNLSVQLGGK